MLKLLKSIIAKLRNTKNSISLSSAVSLNTRMGAGNNIIGSQIINSTLANNSQIDQASIFSSSIGNNTTITTSVIFSGDIADHVNIGSNSAISSTTVGRYTYFAAHGRIFNSSIGAFCSFAENVSIGHAEHPYHQLSTSPVFYKKGNPFNETKFFIEEVNEFKETIIGNDVWIGLNAYIKAGVIIGDGCVIGAGTIVTKNIEPYSIVVGVPGRVIKKRFSDEVINKLISDAWWDLPDNEVLEYARKFGNDGERL